MTAHVPQLLTPPCRAANLMSHSLLSHPSPAKPRLCRLSTVHHRHLCQHVTAPALLHPLDLATIHLVYPLFPGVHLRRLRYLGKPFVCVLELIDAFPFKQRSASAHSSKTASTSPTTAIKAAREARGAACLHMSLGDLAQINKRPSDDKLVKCYVDLVRRQFLQSMIVVGH